MKKVNEVVAYYTNKFPDTLELVITGAIEDSKKGTKTRINDYIKEFFEIGKP
jgi:hypothetical protein